MNTQTLKVYSALIETKTTTSEITVCLVSERWQSWPAICFPICFRLHCCLPAHSGQPCPFLCRVFSFFLVRQTGHIILSQLGTVQCIWFYCLYVMQSKYSTLHGVCEPPYIFPFTNPWHIRQEFSKCATIVVIYKIILNLWVNSHDPQCTSPSLWRLNNYHSGSSSIDPWLSLALQNELLHLLSKFLLTPPRLRSLYEPMVMANKVGLKFSFSPALLFSLSLTHTCTLPSTWLHSNFEQKTYQPVKHKECLYKSRSFVLTEAELSVRFCVRKGSRIRICYPLE